MEKSATKGERNNMGILTSLFLLLLIGATTPSNGQGGADFNFLKDGLVLREQSIINAFENGLHLQRKLITEVEICNAVQGYVSTRQEITLTLSPDLCNYIGSAIDLSPKFNFVLKN